MKGSAQLKEIPKCRTGIAGLDAITGGGLPRGRPTLVCGGAGCGKTLLAMEFVARGARDFNEPGVFMSFEETEADLAANVASLGISVETLRRRHRLLFDHVYIERSEIEDTGEYDLEGLFVRLGSAIDEIGARRVVLDSLEALFSGLPNEAILRAELRRLFRWLKARGVTVLITGEQGKGTLTRHGLEEYVSDCVIFLDHRVTNQVSTRRLRIVKYRGSSHGTNEYPVMITEGGLSVLPISSLALDYPVSNRRISSGVATLDAMLGGKGFFQGSSILISGTAGTGKTSLAVAFADAVCRRGKRCLYASLEESPGQIIRNMRSIGFDLHHWTAAKRMHFHSVRPTLFGLEQHLVALHERVDSIRPHAVVLDPITNFTTIGSPSEANSMLTRLVDFLKVRGITGVFTSLLGDTASGSLADETISSQMDTCVLLRSIEVGNEWRRVIHILKSRGMAHSSQVHRFTLGRDGIVIQDSPDTVKETRP